MYSSSAQKMSNGLRPDLMFAGEYVALEPLSEQHRDRLVDAAADGELWNLPFTGVPRVDQMEEMITEALSNRRKGTQLPFVVRRLSDDRIVGSTRFYKIEPRHLNLSIGYTWYAKSAQRTAVNTECKYLLLSHAFETIDCISVHWHTHHDNLISQAAIERLGAQRDGVLRNHMIMSDGTVRHTHCYSMLDTEWPAAKSYLSKRLKQAIG